MENFNGTPKEITEQVLNSIPKQFEESFSKIITAGMRIMFSDETHELMLDQLEQEGDFAQNIGNAITGLMLLMYQKSNGTMPQELIIPAGIYLLAKGVNFIEKVTGEQVTSDVLSQAIQMMLDTLIEKTGADPKQIYGAMESGVAQFGQGEQ